MNFADSIAQINEKVDDTIQQAKSLLASDQLTGDLLHMIKEKWLIKTVIVQFKKEVPIFKGRKKKALLPQKMWKKAEMMKQIYKAKIYFKNLIESNEVTVLLTVQMKSMITKTVTLH